jgi:hypothetical protein
MERVGDIMAKIDIDLRFVDLEVQLYLFEDYIDMINNQIDLISAGEKQRMLKKWTQEDLRENRSIEDSIDDFIEIYIPQLLYNGLYVNIWSFFESSIFHIAKYIQEEQRCHIGIKEIKGPFIEQASKYYDYILKIPLIVSRLDNLYTNLRQIYTIRNAIVHDNARMANISNEDRKKDIQKIMDKGNTITIERSFERNIIVNPEFLKEAQYQIP